jgi:hypothetical protein
MSNSITGGVRVLTQSYTWNGVEDLGVPLSLIWHDATSERRVLWGLRPYLASPPDAKTAWAGCVLVGVVVCVVVLEAREVGMMVWVP